jgi:hypothetical protein
MIVPITTPEQTKAVCWVFGRLPVEFAFGNCVAWLEISSEYSPNAALMRRGMNVKGEPSGWLHYKKKTCSSNELTELLREHLDQFNSNPVYITVHYGIRN